MYLKRLDLVATMTGAGWWASLTGIRSRYSSGLSREQLAKRARALVQWVKLTAWKVGYRGFEPRSGRKMAFRWRHVIYLTPINTIEIHLN